MTALACAAASGAEECVRAVLDAEMARGDAGAFFMMGGKGEETKDAAEQQWS